MAVITIHHISFCNFSADVMRGKLNVNDHHYDF